MGIIYIISNNNLKANTSINENQYLKTNNENTRIRLSFNDEEMIVNMKDNQSAKDFLSMLPLNLKFEDYNGAEKVSYLPRKINITNATSGIEA